MPKNIKDFKTNFLQGVFNSQVCKPGFPVLTEIMHHIVMKRQGLQRQYAWVQIQIPLLLSGTRWSPRASRWAENGTGCAHLGGLCGICSCWGSEPQTAPCLRSSPLRECAAWTLLAPGASCQEHKGLACQGPACGGASWCNLFGDKLVNVRQMLNVNVLWCGDFTVLLTKIYLMETPSQNPKIHG